MPGNETKGHAVDQGMVPVKVTKPWGYELIWAITGRYVGKILHINKGERLSYQYHQSKDETIFILKGVMEFEYAEPGGERMKKVMKEGECFRIKPGLRHRMIAIEELDVLEASTPELDDVVRLEDSYGRVKR